MRDLSLVIPNHNGARVIEESIRKYNEIFSKKFKKFEMITVCNGCTDNSMKICNQLEKEFPLRTIEIPQKGKGYALIRGFNEAKHNQMGFLDVDNPFDLTRIGTMVDNLDTSDVVIASKYLKGNARLQESLSRRFISLGGGVVAKNFFNLNFSDTQAGAKFFRKNVWDTINKKNNFVCTGFDWDIEFLYRSIKNNFKITETHIPFKPENFSTVRLKYLPGMLKRLLMLRLLR